MLHRIESVLDKIFKLSLIFALLAVSLIPLLGSVLVTALSYSKVEPELEEFPHLQRLSLMLIFTGHFIVTGVVWFYLGEKI